MKHKCSKCQIEKLSKEFNKGSNQGRSSYCKKCIYLYQRELMTGAHREKILAKRRKQAMNRKQLKQAQ